MYLFWKRNLLLLLEEYRKSTIVNTTTIIHHSSDFKNTINQLFISDIIYFEKTIKPLMRISKGQSKISV